MVNQMILLDLWEKIYEKLFGGFEDLDATAEEDEMSDELANVQSMKTKTGYLKDGFIVDDDDEVLQQETDSSDTVLDSNSSLGSDEDDIIQELGDLHLEDVGSELEEEDYLDEDD